MSKSKKLRKVPLRPVSKCGTIDVPKWKKVDLNVQAFIDDFWRRIIKEFGAK